MRIKLILIGLFLVVAIPVYPQAKPAAIGSRSQFAIGAGFSDYASDWSGRYDGGALWADWNPGRGPSFLHGLGLEIEARDLSIDENSLSSKLQLDTIGGGPIYTIRRFRNIHPYAKFLISYASFDFPGYKQKWHYSHDTRTEYTPGFGAEYRIGHNVWVRGDYEYQFFVNFFNHHAMNPNGFTVGASYEF